jgi:hypothetical protein
MGCQQSDQEDKKAVQRIKRSSKKADKEELIRRLELLKSMRVFEHGILDNEERIKKIHCPFHCLLNDGFLALLLNDAFLALLSLTHVALGSSLLQTFADAVNENELNENSDETLKKAAASAKDPKGPLKQSFLELCNGNDFLTMKQKEKLFDELVDKAKNSRAGAVIKRFKSDTTGRCTKAENSIPPHRLRSMPLKWSASVLNATRRAAAASNDLEATMRAKRALVKRWLQQCQC